MIIVRVELHSAITGEVSELARMIIANAGGTNTLGDYTVTTLRGRSTQQLDQRVPQRTGKVLQHQRLALHVWHLVAKALKSVGYGGNVATPSSLLPAAGGEVSRSSATEGS